MDGLVQTDLQTAKENLEYTNKDIVVSKSITIFWLGMAKMQLLFVSNITTRIEENLESITVLVI